MTASRDWTIPGLTIGLVVMLVAGVVLPDWLLNILNISFSRALAVLGLMVLWRTGLISFGHAFYYGLGAYTVAILGKELGVSEILVTVPAAMLVASTVGFFLGFIIRRYRDIFFAMLSLAFSMVLYGILVKTEALGSTDGFSVPTPSFLGFGAEEAADNKIVLYFVLCGIGYGAALLVHRYLQSTLGNLSTAIRDNEIRVEYLGYSVAHAIHVKYVMSAALAGLGGAILAISLSQVDPDSMVNWTISGELVFVTILSGPGSVAAPFIGSVVFELIRTYAFEWLPHAWQLIVGATLLAIIFFLPGGVWSLLARIFGRKEGER
ncbi:MAG: branched-chain amino acid ABC transporter permease [Rhodospirillaceae bacterium]|jgi:ABC-type branched-subunit amino acid transport system permease subunit|nr:branched-chain amino acid ABC transporter permease [Rhodospirillaceae bacterium]MBT6138702.1 branched-chain amino acid ABC transporter permease [Rhodospirillaceae bacterium]